MERVVSQQGIVAIYQFLRDDKFFRESPYIADAIRTSEEQQQAAVMGTAALGKEDPLCCIKAMEEISKLFYN